jgi:uridine kinase
LLRPELDDAWDFRVFVEVDFDVALERAIARDAGLPGSESELIRRYGRRYFPGQRLYLARVDPRSRADTIIDNNA